MGEEKGNVKYRASECLGRPSSLRIATDVTGLAGITIIREPGNDEGLYLSVGLGIRQEPLESLVCELTGLKFDARTTASLITSLGYITPARSYIEFAFTRDTVADAAHELAQLIVEYGVAWMSQYDSLEKILDALRESRFTYNDAARLRIPAIYYLKGDLDSAKAIVSGELLALGQSQGPVTSQYRRFAQNLLKRKSAGQSRRS